MTGFSCAVYVLHPLLIDPLAIVLSPIKMDMDLKVIPATLLAVTLCYLASHGVR